MAQTNVQAFSGDVELNDRFTINSSVGNIKKKSFTNYNGIASTRYWKVFSGSYSGTSYNQINMTVKINRVNLPFITRRLVMEASGDGITYIPTIDENDTPNPSYLRDLRVYKNTADSTYDIYIEVNSYGYVDVDMTYSGNNITVYDTPTWEASEPTTSGTYILDFTNGNNNAMKIDNSGNVGIGTTSPDNVLHIRNAVPAVLLDDSDDDTKVRITGGAGGDLYVDSNWGGSGNTGDIIFREASSEKMRITGSGKVGIGTDNPGASLEVHGADLTGQPVGTTGIISRHVSGLDGVLNIFGVMASNNEETLGLQTQIDGRAWQSDIDGGWSYGTDSRYDLCLQPYKGSVGIGTTNPSDPLHVEGSSLFRGPMSINNASGFGALEIGGPSGAFIDLKGPATDDYDMRFYTDGSGGSIHIGGHGKAMQFLSDGNVGIGTNNPQGKLHLSSGNSGDCVLILEADEDNSNENDNPRIEFWQDGSIAESAIRQSDNYLDIMNSVTTLSGIRFFTGNDTSGYTNAVERMHIDEAGRVGIGTNNPECMLQLSASTLSSDITDPIKLKIHNRRGAGDWSTTQPWGLLEFDTNDITGAGDGPVAGIGCRFEDVGGGDASLCFYTDGNNNSNNVLGAASERMCIDHDGNVGIGTTNPATQLEIRGQTTSSIPTIRLTNTAPGNAVQDLGGLEVYSVDGGGDFCGSIIVRRDNDGAAPDGNIIFRTGANGVSSDRMIVDHNGDVGIGTDNPVCRFDVADNTDTLYLARFRNTSTASDQDARVIIQTSDAGGETQLLLQSTNETTTHAWNIASGAGLTPSLQFQYDTSADYNGGTMAFEIPHGGGARITGIEGTQDYGDTNYGYTAAGLDGNPNPQSFGLDVQSGSIRSNGGLVAYSDTRIKSNIVDINDTYALDQIRAIKPRYYEYVDKRRRGSSSVIGFIAQEVKEVIPRAVSVANGRIPNIYSFANITASNVLTFTDFNTSTLDSNATTEIEVYINGKNPKSVTISEIIDEHNIRVVEDISEWGCSFDENGNVVSEIVNTTLTLDEYKAHPDRGQYSPNISGYEGANVIISVDEYNSLEDKTGYTEVVESYTKTSIMYPGNQIFVWGQGVTDFHHINKDYIWTVAAAALQEVDRQLQAEKIKVVSLESQLTSVLERLDALEGA